MQLSSVVAFVVIFIKIESTWNQCKLENYIFSPLRNNLLYALSHFNTPKVPSDWILRFILKRAPCMDSRFCSTSWWIAVNSWFIRIVRFLCALGQHSCLCWHPSQDSHSYNSSVLPYLLYFTCCVLLKRNFRPFGHKRFPSASFAKFTARYGFSWYFLSVVSFCTW